MKLATLLHNPGAGGEDYDEAQLTRQLAQNGYTVRYISVKDKSWKQFGFDTDFLVIAGGDGTVRQVVKALLDRKMIARTWPIGLLPMGTANNIARTLQLPDNTEENISAWGQHQFKRYDVGCIYYGKESLFFLESFGYGLFPYLMLEMQKRHKGDFESPEAKIKAAQELLQELTMSYLPRHCKLEIDGTDHSGRYLLVEVMNTRSIGPNLALAPHADPGDGILEVVLVPEAEKEKFAALVNSMINGEDVAFDLKRISGRNIRISWEGTHTHIDDEPLKLGAEQVVEIEIKSGMLEFFRAGNSSAAQV